MNWFRQPQVLVYLQFLAIFYYVLSGQWVADGIWLWIEWAGILVVIWAMAVMGLRTFSVFPDPKESGTFTKAGPYRLIRHPMYTGLLSVALALTVTYYSWINLAVILVLCVVIAVKIEIEENMLIHRYGNYRGYRDQTKRLIPFIW